MLTVLGYLVDIYSVKQKKQNTGEMQAAKDMRILIYNGDTDPGLNSFLGQNWTSALNFPVKQSWRPWTLDGKQRMGGYVTR